MPTISVIVPVYNVEKYIHRCVDSILAQTFTDFELILVDDGSPDNCGKICDEYAAKDGRVRVIHQENEGQAAARNAAIAQALGEYVCFIDADDAVHPRMIEILYGALNDTGSDISVCGALESEKLESSFFNDVGTPQVKCYSMNEDALLTMYDFPYVCWVVWGKLIPMDLIRKIPFTAGRFYEDIVVIKWLYEANRVALTAAPLYYYQFNNNGTTKGQWSEKKILDYVWANEGQLNFFKEKKLNRLFNRSITGFFPKMSYQFNEIRIKAPNLSRTIRKTAIAWWRKEGKHVKLTKEEKEYVMSMLHPIITKLREGIRSRTKK